MLAFLAVVGLILGAGLKASAVWLEQDKAKIEAGQDIAIAESEQAAITAQQGEVDKDILAAGDIYNINKKALNIQGQQTAYAGAAAKGQVGARAGAGNLAGASILRQTLSVQRKTEQQMSLLAGEKQKLGIEYSDTLREFDIKKMTLATSLLTSETKETRAQAEIDYLNQYGWLQYAGIGIDTLNAGIRMGTGV